MLHAELAFNACFTVELLLRMIASGGVKAYLTKAWNIFDLAMVLAGYTQFLPQSITGEHLRKTGPDCQCAWAAALLTAVNGMGAYTCVLRACFARVVANRKHT